MNVTTALPVATWREGAGAGRRSLTGLLVPAGAREPVRVVQVEDSNTAISDLIGGALIDDPVTWPVPSGGWVSAYLDEQRAGAPDNPRLSLLATRLGLTDRAFHATAHGNALILGTGPTGVDIDLPHRVLTEAARCGVPIETTPTHAASARP